MNRLLLALVCLTSFVRLAHGDPCRDQLETITNKNANVTAAAYWDGSTLTTLKISPKPNADVGTLFYFHDKTAPRDKLGLAPTAKLGTAQREKDAKSCKKPVWVAFAAMHSPSDGSGVTPPAESNQGSATAQPSDANGGPPLKNTVCTSTRLLTPAQYVKEYREPTCTVHEGHGFTTVAAETVQILGQIVVDRASEAAYSLASAKAKKWLQCSGTTKLPDTCKVLDALRMQDLAMAPDLLRSALTSDALQLIKAFTKNARAVAPPAPRTGALAPPIRPVFAASKAKPTAPEKKARCDETAGPDGLRCALNNFIADQMVAVLARPASTLTAQPAEALIRRLVDKGLGNIENQLDAKICKLADRDRIIALTAVSFAACNVKSGNCDIMNVTTQFEHMCRTGLAAACKTQAEEVAVKCQAPSADCVQAKTALGDCETKSGIKTLSDEQLAYAQSMASHFWQAVTLSKNNVADAQGRLVAALEGGFEAACMYAEDNAGGPYECAIDTSKHDGLTTSNELAADERVAMLRDIVIAAAGRDGAALGRAMIATASRLLPDADNKEVMKGLRVLATVTAYAATYTGENGSSEEAHDQRTSLLKSLTADMTNRTQRGGDVIASFGGSLRAVGGARISREYPDAGMTEAKPHYAVAAPLSVPLGFGLDVLWNDAWRSGLHIELGIVDLGQYLSWEEGGEVAEPELETALSPSLTVAYFWGRELPFFIGLTGGYTPSFDFDTDNDADKKGAFNIGATLGVYVPLFDFN